MSHIIWEGTRIEAPQINYADNKLVWFRISYDSGIIGINEEGTAGFHTDDASKFPIPIGKKFRLVVEEMQWSPPAEDAWFSDEYIKE